MFRVDTWKDIPQLGLLLRLLSRMEGIGRMRQSAVTAEPSFLSKSSTTGRQARYLCLELSGQSHGGKPAVRGADACPWAFLWYTTMLLCTRPRPETRLGLVSLISRPEVEGRRPAYDPSHANF